MEKRNEGFEKGDRIRSIHKRYIDVEIGNEGTVSSVYKGDAFPDSINSIRVRYDKHPDFIYFENGDTIEKIQ